MPTTEDVFEALRTVTDPELGINIVDLGLVYKVSVDEEGVAFIVYTLTSMGCPVGPMIQSDISESVASVDGITGVDAQMTMSPPWGPDKMSEFAKSALGFF